MRIDVGENIIFCHRAGASSASGKYPDSAPGSKERVASLSLEVSYCFSFMRCRAFAPKAINLRGNPSTCCPTPEWFSGGQDSASLYSWGAYSVPA